MGPLAFVPHHSELIVWLGMATIRFKLRGYSYSAVYPCVRVDRHRRPEESSDTEPVVLSWRNSIVGVGGFLARYRFYLGCDRCSGRLRNFVDHMDHAWYDHRRRGREARCRDRRYDRLPSHHLRLGSGHFHRRYRRNPIAANPNPLSK